MIQVRWEVFSKQFQIRNGVKLGGVILPVLFTVYHDNLFKFSTNVIIGFKISNNYLEVFGYKVDLTLLCQSLTGVKKMLNRYVKFIGL